MSPVESALHRANEAAARWFESEDPVDLALYELALGGLQFAMRCFAVAEARQAKEPK